MKVKYIDINKIKYNENIKEYIKYNIIYILPPCFLIYKTNYNALENGTLYL